MTEKVEVQCPDPWFRIGAPNLTDLRSFRATHRQITGAELLLYVEANLQLCDDDVVLFEEPRFEVAELGYALKTWAGDGIEPDHDFEHIPSSSDESGMIRITRAANGWVAGSSRSSRTSTARSWPVVHDSIDALVTSAHELSARSLLESGWSLIEAIAALCREFNLSIADARPIVLRVSGRERELHAFQERNSGT